MNVGMEELTSVQDASRIRAVLPFIRADMEKREAMLKNRIYQKLMEQRLTPEGALQAWHEMFTYHNVLLSLERRVKVGTSAGQAIAPEMNLGGQDG